MPPKHTSHDKYDEMLIYPPVSTADPGESGKLGLADIARSPVQAHFQPVFGTQVNRNRKPQGLEVLVIYVPRMAVEHVHALIERRHARGFGPMQAGSFEKGATQFHRTGREPGRARKQRKGESPQPAAIRIGKGTRPRPSDCAWRRKVEPSGFGELQQGRSESRMPARAPVTKP